MNSGPKTLLILPLLFMLLVPLVAADMISPGALLGGMFIGLIVAYFLNLAINAIIIFACVKGFEKYSLTGVGRVGFLKVMLITIIGFGVDFVMSIPSLALSAMLGGNMLSLYLGIFFLFVGVGVIMALVSYHLLFKKYLEDKYALRSAIIFGVISNPAWLSLILPLPALF